MADTKENTCTGCDNYENYRTERIIRCAFATAITIAGMVGLAMAVPYAGWVLFVGLTGVWAFI